MSLLSYAMMMWYGFLLFVVAAGCATSSFSVVTVPVADVRATPGSSSAPGTHDPLQETQLLYGERVKVLKTDGPWVFVEAIEQAEYTHADAWQGYPGWVRRDALKPGGSTSPSLDSLRSLGPSTTLRAESRAEVEGLGTQPRSYGASQAVVSAKWVTLWADASASAALMQIPMGTKLTLARAESPMWPLRLIDGRDGWISRGDVRLLKELRRLPVELRRQAVVHAAEQLLGDPYFWGGRSPYHASGTIPVTGVDCSGLVNLAYRTVGIGIPRDAHEQYLRARKITTPHPADLLFLSSPEDPRKIVHVMLYAGDGWLIEGPGTGLAVRRVALAARLGVSVENLSPGTRIGNQVAYLGTYLPRE